MLKNLSFLAIGLAIGLAFIVFTRAPSTDDSRDRESPIGVPAEYDRLMADVRDQIQELSVRFAELEARVGELAVGADAAASSLELSSPKGGTSTARVVTQSIQGGQAVVLSRTPSPDELVEQLVAAGFSRQRAEWIAQRSEEFMMELIQARYESERTGEPLQAEPDPQASLRRELGDTEYERYLRAIGREAAVNVMGVIENSPAAQAGLRQGDRIVSYNGQRVFDFREIMPLTLEGTRGESVIIEILRDGQPMQLVVPRGPLGVSLSSDLGVAR